VNSARDTGVPATDHHRSAGSTTATAASPALPQAHLANEVALVDALPASVGPAGDAARQATRRTIVRRQRTFVPRPLNERAVGENQTVAPALLFTPANGLVETTIGAGRSDLVSVSKNVNCKGRCPFVTQRVTDVRESPPTPPPRAPARPCRSSARVDRQQVDDPRGPRTATAAMVARLMRRPPAGGPVLEKWRCESNCCGSGSRGRCSASVVKCAPDATEPQQTTEFRDRSRLGRRPEAARRPAIAARKEDTPRTPRRNPGRRSIPTSICSRYIRGFAVQ
jgi:hypothetical protein